MSNVRSITDNVKEQRDEGQKPVDLTSTIDVLVRYKWTFLCVVATVVGLGLIYAFLGQPVYRADIMVQVEDTSPGNNASKLAASIAPVFDAKPAASAEIELLRSRMVVGRAVDALRLDIDATPAYFPLIGRGISSYDPALSNPGLFGWGGFAWGGESIALSQLEVPAKLDNRPMHVTASGDGKYTLYIPDVKVSAKGIVGEPLVVTTPYGPLNMIVSRLDGLAGARFNVRHIPRTTAVLRLQERLVIVERGKQSGVIGVSLEGTSPTQTAAILNEIAHGYVDQNLHRKAAEAEKSVQFLESQLPQLKQQLEASESRYNTMRNQRGTVDLSEESKLILSQSVQIQTRLQELRQKRQELIARFTSNHPSIEILDNQIAGLTAQLNGVTGRIQKLPDVEQNVLRLMRDVKVNTEMYQSVLNDVQQLKLVKASKVGTARLVDSADVPIKPVRPNRPLVAACAVGLGLILGLLAVAARRAMDGGLTDPDEIEDQCGITVYATIPMSWQQTRLLSTRINGGEVLARREPDDPAIESLRGFRTALQFTLLNARNNVVVITGPAPDAGKSFISANFGVVAGGSGKRVLLIDGDLRRGELNRRFGSNRVPGVTDLLMGARFEDVVQREVSPGLDLIATGSDAPISAELLHSDRIDALLEDVKSRYDLVLIDTPPVLAVSDAGILAPKAGAVFMVARADVTTASELNAARRLIEQAGGEVKGVLFNGLRVQGRWYRSHYHFGKYRYLNRYGRTRAKA